MIIAVLTAVVGGLGAAARVALDTSLARRWRESWTRLLVVNVSGSALLGLLTGLAADRVVGPEVAVVLGAGLCGGYTTFSAASLATVRLVQERRWWTALGSSLGMLCASFLAAALGLLGGLAV